MLSVDCNIDFIRTIVLMDDTNQLIRLINKQIGEYDRSPLGIYIMGGRISYSTAEMIFH